jgi:hypothetical protein
MRQDRFNPTAAIAFSETRPLSCRLPKSPDSGKPKSHRKWVAYLTLYL